MEADPSLLEQHPWLRKYLEKAEAPDTAGSSGSVQRRGTPAAGAGAPAVQQVDVLSSPTEAEESHEEGDARRAPAEAGEDELLDSVFARLQQARAEWLDSDWELAATGFRVVIRGGRWTRQETGKDFDSFRGQASTPDAEAWCRRYQLPLSATFSDAKFGSGTAATLAEGWCHRMEFYYVIFQQSGDSQLDFGTIALPPYEEPTKLRELADGAARPVAERIAQIRGILPKRPVR